MRLEKYGFPRENYKKWNLFLGAKAYSLEQCTSFSDEQIEISRNSLGISSLKLDIFNGLVGSQLPEELFFYIDDCHQELNDFINAIQVYKKSGKTYIWICWGASYSNWSERFNLKLIRDKICQEIKNNNPEFIEHAEVSDDSEDCADLYISFCYGESILIKDAILQSGRYLSELEKNVLNDLIVGDLSHKVVAIFNFPNEYDSICAKYLHYFIEFLSDIGVEANSSIICNEYETLFSIEPKNKEQSLEVIKNALSAYLGLPSIDMNHDFDIDDTIQSLKLEKLRFEVDSLKNALRIKDALLKHSSGCDNKISNFNPIIDSVSEVVIDGKKQNKAEFFDGLIKLGIYKLGPLEIDCGGIVSRLTRKV